MQNQQEQQQEINLETATNLEKVIYFRKRIEAIPDDQWCEFQYISPTGKRCLKAHFLPLVKDNIYCYDAETPETIALKQLFSLKPDDYFFNSLENVNNYYFQGQTPKERALNRLSEIEAYIKKQELTDTSSSEVGTIPA